MTRLALQSENFGAIQSEVFRRAAEIRKQLNCTKSRATLMASDDVAATFIDPPTSGQHLDSWLGTQRIGFKSAPVKNDSMDSLGEIGMPFKDTDDFQVRGYNSALVNLTKKLDPMRPGEVWSFPVKNRSEAEALARLLPAAVRKLNWRTGNYKKSYLAQILDDRLKIKRL